ncbi:hypothetical protein E4U13_004162 [Claviceps humidiphila]|uniref:Uncharacterized protein n=1 Tax=Claviceps humidiphila TaxID=1294629 RepID=A0A9P7TRX6_9HYPO|nr:hypothetical protein E4U13_004162 [Claviceps humidiphila]
MVKLMRELEETKAELEVEKRQRIHNHSPLNKREFLEECHEAGFPVRVQTNLLQVTQGLAGGSICGRLKAPVNNTLVARLGPWEKDNWKFWATYHWITWEKLTTRQSVRNLEQLAPSIDSEVSLRHRQLLLVYGPLELLINDLKRDPDLTDRFGLHDELKIHEHLNGVQTATNPTVGMDAEFEGFVPYESLKFSIHTTRGKRAIRPTLQF